VFVLGKRAGVRIAGVRNIDRLDQAQGAA
jgi:hypothetical protein